MCLNFYSIQKSIKGHIISTFGLFPQVVLQIHVYLYLKHRNKAPTHPDLMFVSAVLYFGLEQLPSNVVAVIHICVEAAAQAAGHLGLAEDELHR